MYSINSLVFCLNYLFIILLFLVQVKKMWIVNGFNWSDDLNDCFLNAYTYGYIILWSVLYTNASLLEIQIVYSRIQLLYPNMTFMKNMSVYR